MYHPLTEKSLILLHETAKKQVADLVYREKTTGLTAEEMAELNHYLELEHLMRLAKARTRHYLKDE